MTLRVPRLALASFAVVVVLSGCAGTAATVTAPTTSTFSVVPVVIPLGELEAYGEPLSVGSTVAVIVDTPETSWTVSSSDPAIVEVDDPSPGSGAREVTITGVAPGRATVTFVGGEHQVVHEWEVTR